MESFFIYHLFEIKKNPCKEPLAANNFEHSTYAVI